MTPRPEHGPPGPRRLTDGPPPGFLDAALETEPLHGLVEHPRGAPELRGLVAVCEACQQPMHFRHIDPAAPDAIDRLLAALGLHARLGCPVLARR